MVIKGDEDVSTVETMDLAGGELCLDFVNTASGRTDAGLQEKLHDYGDLVTWSERVELAGPERAARLREGAEREPAGAAAVLERARALRESIYRLFARREAEEEDLSRLAAEAGEAAASRRLVAEGDGSGAVAYVWEWPATDRLEQLLWPIALSAADLLTSEELDRVKECAAADCSWLFLDESRNRSRRWCDMKVCGNRAKARRFTARQREQAE